MTTALPPARVLIVDDIEENLIALGAMLRRIGVHVTEARSGREALELLLVHEFALALLDVNMPEMDGFQLAELMRGTQRTRQVPIIFVTAAYDAQRQFRGYESGAVDFLVKPVEPKILLSKVETFIALYDSKRQLAQQLAQTESLSARLSESLRLHEMFVAALNHDLRSPLHAITLGTTLLAGELTDPAQQSVVARVETAALRMSTMLDQLYDLARTRLGEGISIAPTAGDLKAVVEEVLREAELRRGTSQLALEATGDTTGEWDLPRISRVAANLVTNALVHGTKGGTVTVKLDGRAPERVTLAVHNGGVIPEAIVPFVFEPFRRGGRSGHGLGLGLYIVREIATAHGGDVTVVSNAASGTELRVELPRHARAAAAAS